MSPQEKCHDVMARIRTTDLTIKRPTLYHLSYPARQQMYTIHITFCYLFSVKLMPNTTYGALQMLVNATTSTFGLVCSDGFGAEEASVACNELGYPYGLHMCCSAFGYIYSPRIMRTNLQCTGSDDENNGW
jgi:hypothetical protein